MLAALLVLAGGAHAFAPEVHRALAARALELEAVSSPGLVEEARRFPLAAAGEDWNLVRKWGRWHHYGHPAPLAWRRPSEERVAMLELAVRAAGNRDRAWALAGFAAHHVQDMASPPHVVPVAHGLGDGFEDYDVRALIAVAGSEGGAMVGASAGGVELLDDVGRSPRSGSAGGLGWVEAHRALARATADALVEPLACEDGPLPWTRFWQPRPGKFGRLGDLRFGGVAGCDDGTLAFVRARIEAAVAYTRVVVRAVSGMVGG